MKRTSLRRTTPLRAKPRATAAGPATLRGSGAAVAPVVDRARRRGASSGASRSPVGAAGGALGTANASNTPGLAHAKPPRVQTERTRRRRADQAAFKAARAVVFLRDPRCRYPGCTSSGADDECAHLDGWKRAQTRGRPPEERHVPKGLMRLCRAHHAGYDGALGTGKMFTLRAVTEAGADGPCEFYGASTGRSLGVT